MTGKAIVSVCSGTDEALCEPYCDHGWTTFGLWRCRDAGGQNQASSDDRAIVHKFHDQNFISKFNKLEEIIDMFIKIYPRAAGHCVDRTSRSSLGGTVKRSISEASKSPETS